MSQIFAKLAIMAIIIPLLGSASLSALPLPAQEHAESAPATDQENPGAGAQQYMAGQQTQGQRSLFGFFAINTTFGGDTLAKVYMSNNTTEELTAGGGLLEVKVGIEYQIIPWLSIQGSVGWHWTYADCGDSGTLEFVRFPVEGLLFLHVADTIKFGVGVRKALGPKVFGTGDMPQFISDFTLESSFGLVFELDYRFPRQNHSAGSAGFCIRYVSEQYRDTSSSPWISGGHIALGIVCLF